MHKHYRLMFVISIVCGLLAAAVGVYGYNTTVKLVPVVVSARDIRADEVVTGRMLSVSREPVGSLRPDTIRTYEELRGVVARGFIPAGTPLRASMFQPVGRASAAGRLASLGDDKVVIALNPSLDTTVGGAVRRGDNVVIKAVSRKNASEADVEVLVEKALIFDMPKKDGPINAVLLAVTAPEADKIAVAQRSGKAVWFELLPVEEGDAR